MSAKKKMAQKIQQKDENKEEVVQVNNDNDAKYNVALKFVNMILTNLGKETIDDLTKFKDIDRNDIIKEENKKGFEQMESKLFEYFNKANCGWYRRKKVSNYILTFLRYMCEDLEYSLTYYELKKQQNKIVESIMLYSINKK